MLAGFLHHLGNTYSYHFVQVVICEMGGAGLLSQGGVWHLNHTNSKCLATDLHGEKKIIKIKQTEAALLAQEATQNEDCVGTSLPHAGGKQSSPSALGDEEDMCSPLPLLLYSDI